MHGKNTRVFGGEFDFSTVFKGSGIGSPIDMAENTTYQTEDKTYEPGLSDGELSLDAVYKATEDTAIVAWVKSVAGEVWSRLLNGAAVGSTGHTLQGRLKGVDTSAPVGDLVTVAYVVQADGGVDQVTSLHDVIAAETSAGSEVSHDGGTDNAPTLNGGVASVHLVAFTGTDITIKVEDSANDSTWADIALFTQLTAEGSEKVVVPEGTTVDRYLRATWTGTFTSATFVVVFGRR